MMTNLNTKILNELNRDFTKPRMDTHLEPWQVTGLTDGEGGFYCSILQTGSGNTGVRVKLEYKVVQKTHSEGVLLELQEFFSCGSVVIDNRKTETKKFHVTSLSNILENIIPHFDLYPCLTSKYLNYSDWKKIAITMKNKEHLSQEGLEQIRELSSKMNTRRNFVDKYNYLKKSLYLDTNGKTNFSLPEQWLQAFIDGEGLFYNYIYNSTPDIIDIAESERVMYAKNYLHLDSSLEIAQANHDVLILLAIKNFFNGGYLKPKYNVNLISECEKSRSVNRFILRDTKKIIKFLDLYPLLTRKYLDYVDWKTIVNLKINGQHKSPEGLELIKKIKAKMNSKRDSN
jgi:hypothetical protein